MPHGEITEDGLAIIADRSQPESLFLKSLFSILQLHELRFAKGSPIGGAEEKKHRAIRLPSASRWIAHDQIDREMQRPAPAGQFPANRGSHTVIRG